jgi:choline dehydrogenase-like flavoprotein
MGASTVAATLGQVGLPAPLTELAARRWDVVVVGGGHNGLTAAAYLARAGRSVLVLERRERLGGACTLEQPFHDPRYLSNADPGRTLALVDPEVVPAGYRARVDGWQLRSPVVKLNAALHRLPTFLHPGRGRLGQPAGGDRPDDPGRAGRVRPRRGRLRGRLRGPGPPDIERRIGLTGGHIFQGETMPDQMWERRLPARTPVPGLCLCGAATHPAAR